MGSGHLRRCLALASALRQRGARIEFLCRKHPGNLNHEVVAAGHELHELEPPGPPAALAAARHYEHWLGADAHSDANETAKRIAAGGKLDLLVVDHYAIDARWEKAIRGQTRRLVVIDDLADREHACDVLVDSAPGSRKFDRYSRLAPGARLLIGPGFALLRGEFAQASPADRDEVRRIVITFGAVDGSGYSVRAVSALRAALPHEVALDVVIGSTSPQVEVLRRLATEDDALHVHESPDDVASIFSRADLAVISAGVTAWECAALGLPAVATAIVPNQAAVAAALAELPCALLAQPGSFERDVADCASVLSRQRPLRQLFAKNARAAVDGRGASRVARIALPEDLSVRPARAEDSRDVWFWRNEPKVRESSRNSAVISWEDHDSWYSRTLADDSRRLLIAESAGAPVAVVRFDAQASAAEISIYLTPSGHGRGLGAAVLSTAEQWLQKNVPGITRVNAFVRSGNEASRAAFLQAGYEIDGMYFSRKIKASHVHE
jgi:UDP-2,4-diacetamido-2,4,6-trideoxy-beta-L-altropyranose hydrolase